MSLTELSELFGKMGAATRTGPISVSKKRCLNCGEHVSLPIAPSGCPCRNCPIRQKIRQISHGAPTPHARESELMNMLRMQSMLLGVIISRQTGKCIGAIDNQGVIKHCDASSASGPYRIIIKPTSHDEIPYAGTGAVKGALPIGQCVGMDGKTVAELVRKNQRNRIALTKSSRAPVIAIVMPAVKPSSAAPSNSASASSLNLDQLIRESKELIDAASA